MGNLFGLLYERFLFRDIIGKLTPGFIVFITLYCQMECTLNQDIINNLNSKLFIWLIFPISYLLGLILQISSELIGIHWTCRAPNFILFFSTKKNAFLKNRLDEHQNNLRNMSRIKNENVHALNERHIALKEGAGNFASAVLFLIIIGSFREGLNISNYLLPLVVICGLGFTSHIILVGRYIKYQNIVLKKNDQKNNLHI